MEKSNIHKRFFVSVEMLVKKLEHVSERGIKHRNGRRTRSRKPRVIRKGRNYKINYLQTVSMTGLEEIRFFNRNKKIYDFETN